MQIDFPTGERIAFSWREGGTLHRDLLRADPASNTWTVATSANLSGEPLMRILECFTKPLLRRALLIAAQFPTRER